MAIVGVAVPALFAQGGMRHYNPTTEITVKGSVDDVRQVTRGQGWGGTHLTLKTDKGTLDVHLGPSRFLESKKFTISKGDQVEVIGSKVQYQGHDALIAREITKGDQKLILRNAEGIPEWSGGGNRQP
jgi:DNA/RNA endonuclease YhcR with UshA esterase domain